VDVERDRRDFEAQAVPLLGFLLGMASRLTRERTAAEDLVQESLLKAYRAFPSFRRGTNFRAWVARILVNTHLNDRGRRSRTASGVDPDGFADPAAPDDPLEVTEEAVRAIEDIPRGALGDEVRSALDGLPQEMALAVYLADVEGLTYEEIGEILGSPAGTVRSRIYRGRRRLQEWLLEYARKRGMTDRTKP
jgi:RNA polymerase sigma-70 factor (ECF subfamily)